MLFWRSSRNSLNHCNCNLPDQFLQEEKCVISSV